MNEVQLLRREIAGQRRRTSEVAASWASRFSRISSDKTEDYDKYFEFILVSERERLCSHLERLRSHPALGDAERQAVERCARAFAALAIEGGSEPVVSVSHLTELLSRLEPIARQIETIAERHYGVEDWRRTAHVDADSILEERRLRERALGHAQGNERSDGPAGG